MEKPPEITFPVIDRAAIRAFVASEMEFQRQAQAEGENIHQVSLDRQDLLQAYMATLSAEDLDRFITLYEQEMTAATQAILDNTASINSQNLNRHVDAAVGASNVARWISIISFFAVLIFFIKAFKD